MLAVCYRYAHNREDAEDMLQEGFIKVFSQIHTFENRGALEGWIRRIIVHTCINILKKNKKFNESVDLIHANALQVREDAIPSIIQAKDGTLHATYSYHVGEKGAKRDAAGKPMHKSIKHAHFNVGWVRQGSAE